ncbi:MAG: NAD(P)H-dependent oxidoreductase [Chiayiivirga sp.]|jgi:chromate reductase|uniref:NADPH-dependent FMN reductase n=1 Tax=Chiayiivirga sp. TaxID=2041042 RepID=UPI0025C4F0A3|nr:NADPH-dependent FMN reductase [Chiayiivirga sp.]MCI1710244.1 NAD(P)H-dependent oxidoreductase [Chiayiivirga sp.]MCI1728962.1 NAD(P)H-dependent oxidoreductase [Chiayiivirga sp.]
MSEPIRLLAFAGSLRAGSLNRKLIRTLEAGASAAGAEVTHLELRDCPLPIYDGDIEAAGMPETVRRLQQMMRDHDGLLISTPEYNGSMPALVKNTLDWISRPMLDGRSGTALFRGKVAGICSASPGMLGGIRSLIVLRDALAKLGLWVAPSQVALGNADSAFDANDELLDAKRREAVQAVARETVRAAQALLRPER